MNGMAGGRHREPGRITAPARLVVPRPEHGWVIGLAGAGVRMLAGLAAVVAALAVLAGITVVLWWAGDATIPLVVVVYLPVAVAVFGFVAGRASRGGLLRFLPRGPEQITWEPRAGRARGGLVWEQPDSPAADDGAAEQAWQGPGGDGL